MVHLKVPFLIRLQANTAMDAVKLNQKPLEFLGEGFASA